MRENPLFHAVFQPHQTIAPLLEMLRGKGDVFYNDSISKTAPEALAAAVLDRPGTVLACWEHSRIPEAIAALPHPPEVPAKWSIERFDLIWVLDRKGDGWSFSERPQQLLAGDH